MSVARSATIGWDLIFYCGALAHVWHMSICSNRPMRSPDRTEGHRSAKAPQKTLGLWSKMRFWDRYNINFSVTILGLTGHAKTSKYIGVFNMNDDTHNAFGYGMVFGALFGAIPLMMVGSWLSGMEYERVAIEAKVGEYNPKTGVFQYKTMEEDDKK